MSLVSTTTQQYKNKEKTHRVDVAHFPAAYWLFNDTRSAPIWLILRLWLGWSWLVSGWEKLTGTGWLNGGSALKGFWERAVIIPPTGRPTITYDWWRDFLQMLLGSQSYQWFSWLIVLGEIAVGLGLIFGLFTGIAAFFGLLMNFSYMLSGSASTNPVMLLAAVFLIIGWRVAGWWGLDRYLLKFLGTPWQPGAIFNRKKAPQKPEQPTEPQNPGQPVTTA